MYYNIFKRNNERLDYIMETIKVNENTSATKRIARNLFIASFVKVLLLKNINRMVASVKATISGPSKDTVTISVVEPEQNYIGKDMSPISQPIL